MFFVLIYCTDSWFLSKSEKLRVSLFWQLYPLIKSYFPAPFLQDLLLPKKHVHSKQTVCHKMLSETILFFNGQSKNFYSN